MDYLVSANASDAIHLNTITNRWILESGCGFSVRYLNKRNRLVESLFDNKAKLSLEEELAINGVVLLDDDLQSDMVDEDVYDKACQYMNDIYRQFEEEEETYDKCVMESSKV